MRRWQRLVQKCSKIHLLILPLLFLSCDKVPQASEIEVSLKKIARPIQPARKVQRTLSLTLPSYAECHILVDSRSPEAIRKEFGNLHIEQIIGEADFFVPSTAHKDFGVMSRSEIKRRLEENQAQQFDPWTGAPPHTEPESLLGRDLLNDLHKFPKRLWIADYLIRIPRNGYMRVNPEKILTLSYQAEEQAPLPPPDTPVHKEHEKYLEQKDRIQACRKSNGLFLYLHYLDSQDIRCVRQADALAVFTCSKEVLK